jgi:hypothetical protein
MNKLNKTSTRETSILLSEAINVKKRYVVCFRPTKDVQYTSHLRPVLLSAHSEVDRACIILHSVIIDDEWDGGYNENYHTITSVVALPINYEALTSLTCILQKETHDQACVEQVTLY